MDIGTLIGGVASGVNALASLSGSRDSQNMERAKELQRYNNAQQREMVQDTAMLQKSGMKRAGLSVAALNGGFTPANSPQAQLPSLSSDAQMSDARTSAISSLSSLLQNSPVLEAQKEALQSQRDVNKAQLPKIAEEKQNIANANQYFIESKDKMLAQLDASLQESLSRKDLSDAQKDKAKQELEKVKSEIAQITFNMENTAKLTSSQLAKTRQDISESLSRTALNKALKSETESKTLLNNINAGFAKLGLGGNDSVSAILRIASTSPELFDKLKNSFTEMVNRVNPLAVGATQQLLNGIDELSKFLQDKSNKFFDGIYNGHYEMKNGKMVWVSK